MKIALILTFLIQLLPLLAFAAIWLLPKSWKGLSPLLSVTCSLGAALSAWALFLGFPVSETQILHFGYPWLLIRDITVSVGFLIDPLNMLMLLVVTGVSFFVQLFSVYYMAEDPSKPRYFSFLSLFSFSMTGVVLASNILQTFFFWELVGFTSYLLIGFWYQKDSAANAARKAFVMTRLGDLGFYLGILFLIIFFGSVSYTDMSQSNLSARLSPAMITTIGLLIFCGIAGKSAQFPLYVWLPDAMEGPTPVSALIHSATMVAAGVFMLARGFTLFSLSSTTLSTLLTFGAITALMSALLATAQRDIKRILAYSTVSQLGLMVMALGARSSSAAMFHLTTHACFKSLLFLTAGAYIHTFHTNDIWEIARKGAKRKILTTGILLIGLFSLSGIFPFAGFFSKDLILDQIKNHSPIFYWAAILVSVLTSYYSFRLAFIILLSKAEKPHAHHETHLVKFASVAPLLSLAGASFAAGFLGTPVFENRLLQWLGSHEEIHFSPEVFITSFSIILTGAVLAFIRFRNPSEAEKRFESGKWPLRTLLTRKFYLDDIYFWFTRKVALRFASLCHWFDKTIINGLMVNQTAYSVMRLGRLASRLQSGIFQDYLFFALLAGMLLILYCLKGNAHVL